MANLVRSFDVMGILAPRDGELSARSVNGLDCPTTQKGGLEAKGLFSPLSNETGPPDPEIEAPPTAQIGGASETDQLGSLIEGKDKSAAASTQARCENCGAGFEPRKRSGGKPQRFCSPTCRQAFHANTNANVGPRRQRVMLGNTPAVIGDGPGEKRIQRPRPMIRKAGRSSIIEIAELQR